MAKHTFEFIQALNAFQIYVSEKVSAHYIVNFSNLPVPTTSVTHGSKYSKVFLNSEGRSTIYAFVEKSTGMIFKPASRNAPAEHARGNIYNEMTWTCVGVYGIAYIRGVGANHECFVNDEEMGKYEQKNADDLPSTFFETP